MSTVASALSLQGTRQSGQSVRTQNGKIFDGNAMLNFLRMEVYTQRKHAATSHGYLL